MSFPVSDADPEYFFKKKLKDKDTGLTNRPLKLKCMVNSSKAKITWQKAGIKIAVSIVAVVEIPDKCNHICNKTNL